MFQFTAEEFLYQNQWGGISLLNAINLSERVLMSNTTFVSITLAFPINGNINFMQSLFPTRFHFSCKNVFHVVQFHFQKTLAPVRFSLSADKKYLLLALNVQKLFRHSQIAQYSVYDIQTR